LARGIQNFAELKIGYWNSHLTRKDFLPLLTALVLFIKKYNKRNEYKYKGKPDLEMEKKK
jgi:hypothetical protein